MGCRGRRVFRAARTGLTAVFSACAGSSPGNAPSPAVQAPGSGGFYLIYGRDTLVEERYSRSPTQLEGQYLDRVRHVRVGYAASLASDGSIRRLQMTSSRAGAPDSVREIIAAGDTVRVGENGVVRWVAGADGAQLILGPSGAMIEQLIIRARRITSLRTGTARDTVTLRTFEATSGRVVGLLTIRWFGNDSASATVPGVAGVTRMETPNGVLAIVHYPIPVGMRLVRADSRR